MVSWREEVENDALFGLGLGGTRTTAAGRHRRQLIGRRTAAVGEVGVRASQQKRTDGS
jgi:hypothetical protein